MLVKVDGKGPWVDTHIDWGYKDDVAFATDMYDKKRRFEAEAILKNIEIGRLNDLIEEMKRTGVKRRFVKTETDEVATVEAENGETINEYVVRLTDYAYNQKCNVKGKYNDISLSADPNTSPDFLLGRYQAMLWI